MDPDNNCLRQCPRLLEPVSELHSTTTRWVVLHNNFMMLFCIIGNNRHREVVSSLLSDKKLGIELWRQEAAH